MSKTVDISFPLRLFRITGHNVQKDTKCSMLISFLCFLLVNLSMTLVMIDFVIEQPDGNEIHLYFTGISNDIMFSIKLVVYRAKIKLMNELIKSMDDLWPIGKTGPENAKIQMKFYKLTDYVIRFDFCLAAIISVCFYITIVFERKLNFERSAIFLQSPYYELCLALESFNMFMMPSFMLGFNGLMYICLIICYCQLLMLNKCIKDLNFEHVSNADEEKRVFGLLKTYMKYSTQILTYFRNVNEVFSYNVFAEFYVGVINNCVPLYMIARFGISDVKDLIRATVTISATMWQLIITSVMSTMISHQFEALATNIYNTNWANSKLSPRLRVGLLMIMQRWQRGEEFIAGEILAVNMPNLLKIVQLGFSFFTVMKTLND